MKPIHVKWVLAHEPINIFIRAAEKFVEVAERMAPGKFDIEVLTLSEYSSKYNQGLPVTRHDLLDLMDTGAIEMSQMYTYVLSQYNQDLNALDLPFLFTDHDHASRVFESAIGETMLAEYTKNSNIKGMAFTYSGGFMNLPINRKITSLSDMVGAKVRVSNSPVAAATWKNLGAEPVVMDIEMVADGLQSKDIDAGESSWPRIYGSDQHKVAESILEPNHRLLLTNIIINKNFLANLAPEMQEVFKQAALEAGRYERDIAVNEVATTKEKCHNDGIYIHQLDDADLKLFKEKSQDVYKQFENTFTPGLVDKIRLC